MPNRLPPEFAEDLWRPGLRAHPRCRAVAGRSGYGWGVGLARAFAGGLLGTGRRYCLWARPLAGTSVALPVERIASTIALADTTRDASS